MSRLLKEVPLRNQNAQQSQPSPAFKDPILSALEETRKHHEQMMMREMMREMGGSVPSSHLMHNNPSQRNLDARQVHGGYQPSQLLREVPNVDAFRDPVQRERAGVQILGEVPNQKNTARGNNKALINEEQIKIWGNVLKFYESRGSYKSKFFQIASLDINVNNGNPIDYVLHQKMNDSIYINNPVHDEYQLSMLNENKASNYTVTTCNIGGINIELIKG